MCDNPFIVHEFFCAREKGTRRSSEREQTRFNCCRRAQTAPRSRRGILRIVVTIMQQFDCNPQFGLRNYPRERAARIKAGSASAIAAVAPLRSPAAIASSTLRIADRMRVRRDLLMMVRRAAWRAAFFADFVFAIRAGHKTLIESGAYRVPPQHRQRHRQKQCLMRAK